MVQSDLKFGATHLLQPVYQLKRSRREGKSGKLASDFVSYSSSIVRGIALHSPFVFYQRRMRAKPLVTTLAASFLLCFILCSVPGFASKPPTGESSNTKSCYLCLHLNESAAAAKTAPAMSTRQTTAACAAFTSKSLHDFVFPCPTQYVECLQRINDANSIGSCPMLSPDNCKIENYVKFCYCPDDFCNLILSDRSSPESSELSRQSSKLWRKEETDDEDLLGPIYPHIPQDYEEMQGDSGSGDHPPGVIRIETTTIKPTLVPNLRADSRTTAAPTTSVASSFRVSIVSSICLVLYIIM